MIITLLWVIIQIKKNLIQISFHGRFFNEVLRLEFETKICLRQEYKQTNRQNGWNHKKKVSTEKCYEDHFYKDLGGEPVLRILELNSSDTTERFIHTCFLYIKNDQTINSSRLFEIKISECGVKLLIIVTVVINERL